MAQLEGKIALITGAGTGIGAAMAKRFVADGAKVCLAGIEADPLNQVVASLPAGSAVAVVGDVSKEADVERMVAAAVKFGGRLDVLVNNAASGEVQPPIAEMDPALWRRIFDVNLTGPFMLMRASIPHMLERGGSIINIASLAGVRAAPGLSAYHASKAGLIMLTQQGAVEYGPHKIRCNAVCPGGVKTPLLNNPLHFLAQQMGISVDDAFAQATEDVPLRRFAEPSEIAGLCSYLASDDASFVTGAALMIDGGASIVDSSGTKLVKMIMGATQQ